MTKIILDRLKQRSTWAGVATLSATIGWQVSPEQWSAVAAAVLALVGLYEVFRKEK